MKPATRRKMALGFTLWVVACQVAVVGAFLLDPSDPPHRGSLWQALWALAHKPAFYPLVLVLITGPPLTWLALGHKGGHRRWLLGSWAVFAVVIGVFFWARVTVMVQVLIKHGAG